MSQFSNGLARAVGAEIADHLTLCNLKIKVIQGRDVAVALRQPFGPYGRDSHRR
jgi:hypothetical protein